MSKKPIKRAAVVAESAVWAAFVIAAGFGSMSLLNVVSLTDATRIIAGYALGAFALLAFLYTVYKSVENKV